MSDEPKVAAPTEAREPMTAKQWVDKLHALIEEGKAEGLNPYQLMGGLGLKQVTGIFENLLAAMDTAPAKKK